MTSTTSFTTPRLLIADYYDALINRIDIYTEKLIARHKEKNLLPKEPKAIDLQLSTFPSDNDELFGEKYHQDAYLSKYNYDHIEARQLNIEPGVTKVHDYLNQVRARQIDEIEKVKKHNLDMYEMNKLAYKINPSGMNEADLEQMRSRIFADKFCFLIEINKIDYSHPNKCIFKLYTVITDFYISQTDLEIFKSFKVTNRVSLTSLNENSFLTALSKPYVYDLVAKQKYGFEVISINKQSIQTLQKAFISVTKTPQYDEINLDFLDMASTKSLHLDLHEAGSAKLPELISLDAFSNLEYLMLYYTKLKKSCLNGLNELKKLKLNFCDLSEFDWVSPSLSSLLKLEIYYLEDSPSFDFRSLFRLEWLELRSLNKPRIQKIKNLCENLIYLNVSTTNIIEEKFNGFFANNNKIRNLMILHLNSNELKEIRKEWISSLPNLKYLFLEENRIEDLTFLECESLSNLENLNLRDNQISKIKQENFSKVVNLKRIDLSCNKISEFSADVFSNLSNLEEVNLSFSYTAKVIVDKDAFFGLINLFELNLSSNRIDKLNPVVFSYTPKLTHLNLAYNSLNIDKEFFSHLKNLKKISVFPICLSKEAYEYILNSNIKTN